VANRPVVLIGVMAPGTQLKIGLSEGQVPVKAAGKKSK
jgi:hypothetical protein